jgi:hypothetical protein
VTHNTHLRNAIVLAAISLVGTVCVYRWLSPPAHSARNYQPIHEVAAEANIFPDSQFLQDIPVELTHGTQVEPSLVENRQPVSGSAKRTALKNAPARSSTTELPSNYPSVQSANWTAPALYSGHQAETNSWPSDGDVQAAGHSQPTANSTEPNPNEWKSDAIPAISNSAFNDLASSDLATSNPATSDSAAIHSDTVAVVPGTAPVDSLQVKPASYQANQEIQLAQNLTDRRPDLQPYKPRIKQSADDNAFPTKPTESLKIEPLKSADSSIKNPFFDQLAEEEKQQIQNDTNAFQTTDHATTGNQDGQVTLDLSEPNSSTTQDSNDFELNLQPKNQLSAQSNRVPAKLTSATTAIPAKLPTTPTPKTPKPKTASPKPSNSDDGLPSILQGANNYKLAAQPELGAHWKDDAPQTDQRAYAIEAIKSDFSPDPINPYQGYDPHEQMQIYQGKTLNSNQRPILELGRPWYQLGQLSPGKNWFGKHNVITPQFLVYGDVRTAIASNTQNGDNVSQVAFEVNLDFDLKITNTERFHMFMAPVDDGRNTRWLLDDDEFVEEFDADIDFGYFEGDLGAIVGGFTNQTLPFDLPFAVGVMPLLLQNGVWMEDAFLGVAATIPARNSAKLGISNMDFTFFAGYDKITSDAFVGDDSAARMYGMAGFIEAWNGYLEVDYAYFDDRTFEDRSYHNVGIGFTRRIGRLLSNSTRVIVNAGQQSAVNTADGVLLLSENSLITHAPSTLVPYMNFFAGFDRPQSAARAAGSGGVLRNTGILFESDGMTGYPTLDPTANDTFGGALGINLIADDFSQQLVVEMAALNVMNDDPNRNAAGPQYGLGFRYQLPLTNAIILRMDGMYGFLEDDQDVRGLRMELRHKY